MREAPVCESQPRRQVSDLKARCLTWGRRPLPTETRPLWEDVQAVVGLRGCVAKTGYLRREDGSSQRRTAGVLSLSLPF